MVILLQAGPWRILTEALKLKSMTRADLSHILSIKGVGSRPVPSFWIVFGNQDCGRAASALLELGHCASI